LKVVHDNQANRPIVESNIDEINGKTNNGDDFMRNTYEHKFMLGISKKDIHPSCLQPSPDSNEPPLLRLNDECDSATASLFQGNHRRTIMVNKYQPLRIEYTEKLKELEEEKDPKKEAKLEQEVKKLETELVEKTSWLTEVIYTGACSIP
jgi:hypothetical protein